MKIYTQDCGWRGMIVVVANSEKDAREQMKEAPNYYNDSVVEEHDIKIGFFEYNTGDM